MSNSKAGSIDLFFEDPTNPPNSSRAYSVLYLLRRDIRICLGIHPDTGSSIEYQAIWPGAMAILAGIDLLGKFLAGGDSTQKSGQRFKNFVREYFKPISSDDAETIYQLRNALMHSFGLRSETRKGRIYKFVLTAKGEPLVQRRANDNYWIDVLTLHNKFESAIAAYQADLENNQDFQRHFSAMFPKYGKIHIFDPAESAFKWLLSAQMGKASSFDDIH